MSDILYEGKSKIICTGPDNGSLILRYKDTGGMLDGYRDVLSRFQKLRA